MKHKLSTRVLSMLMAIIMMLSLTTSVFAADPPASAEPEVIVEEAAQNSPAPSASPAPGDDPSRLSTVYEGHRIHYIDSKKQPLPKNAELFMNEINEDDVPFYLQRAAHSLGLESCGMYLYFIADPLLEDASTAEILKYQANPDDPEDRMTVEITLIDDSKMTDEEKELRLEELQNIHLEDLRVIQLGAYWDYDTILPHSEENGVIRFEIEKIAPFILFIPDWESAVQIPEEPEPAEVPEVPEEIAAPTEDTGTQQETEPVEQLPELTQVPEETVDTVETVEPVSEVPEAPTPDDNIQNPEPASDEEPVEEVNEQTVTASGSDYSVSLTYTSDANIPEGSMFELSELPASGILYDNLTTSVASTLNAEAEEISSVTFVDVDVKKDGDSVPLDAPVSVSIAVDDPADGDTVTQVVALGQQNEVLNIEAGTGTYSSTTDSLSSTYAIVRITKQATLKTSDDQTWLITVSYDRDDPAIPADVELSVNELKEGDPGYDEYMAASAAVTGADQGSIAFAKAFDICLIDPATGLECQPTKEVSVSVQLLEEKVSDSAPVDVIHFGDEESPKQLDAALNAENAIEFATPGFSVFVIMQVIKEQVLTASDGNNYLITVTYDNTSGIPKDAELIVSEIKEGEAGYDEYVEKSASALGENPENLAFIRPFDITLKNPQTGEEYQPNKDVQVSIQLLNDDLNAYASVDVVHIHGEGDTQVDVIDSIVEGESVAFKTDGFSVYVLLAKPSYDSNDNKVENLSELRDWYNDSDVGGQGFFLSYSNMYFTNKVVKKSGNSVLEENKSISAAGRWYFEAVAGIENTYYIYTYVGGLKKYIKQISSNNNNIDLVGDSATPFTLSVDSEGPSKFYFKVAAEDRWLQHSNGGGGIRLYIDKNNATNSQITITYAYLYDHYESGVVSDNLNWYVNSAEYKIDDGTFANVTTTRENNPAFIGTDKPFTVKLHFSSVPIQTIKENSQLFYRLPGNSDDLDFNGNISAVIVNIGGADYTLTASTDANEPRKLKLDFGEDLINAKSSFPDSTTVGDFTVSLPLVMKSSPDPADYDVSRIEFGDGVNLYVDTAPHNPKIDSFEIIEEYNPETGTITYELSVRAEGDVSSPVDIQDVNGDAERSIGQALHFKEGSYTLTRGGSIGDPAALPEFPLTIDSMQNGDIITVTYTVDVNPDEIAVSGEATQAEVGNQASLTNEGNAANDPSDDYSAIVMPVSVDFSDIDVIGSLSAAGIGADGRPYQDVTWTITANSQRYANLLGTIEANLSGTRDTLPVENLPVSFAGEGITVTATDENEQQEYNATVKWTDLERSDNSWSWSIPESLRGKYDLTITYVTRFDLSGLTEEIDVTNSVTSHMGNESSAVTVSPDASFLTKTHVNETVQDGKPVHTFEIFVGGVTEDSLDSGKLVIQDKLDTDSAFAALWTISGNPVVSAPGMESATPGIEASCNDGTITFALTPIRNAGGAVHRFYKITYSIEPVDLADLRLAVLTAGGNRTFTNTAEVTFGTSQEDLSAQTEYSFTYSPISKTLDEVDGYWASYTVDINPDSLTMGNNNSLTVLDELSGNQEIERSSINALDADGNPVSGFVYNFETPAKSSFTVPDETHVLLSYKARLMGAEGETIAIFNTATLDQYNLSVTASGEATISGESHSGDTLLCTFIFRDGDEVIHTQTVASIDELIIPQPVPSGEDLEFAGWYDADDVLYDFENASIEEGVERIELHSEYRHYAYVYFHDQYDIDTRDYPVAHTRRVELTQSGDSWTGRVKISDLSVAYRSTAQEIRVFRGWSREPVQQPGQGKDKIITDTEDGWVDIAGRTDFYPVFLDAHRLVYVAGEAGSGASYVPAVSYCEGEGPTRDEVPVSQRDNYTFLGWWTTPDYQEGTKVFDADDGLIPEFDRDGVKVVTTGLGSYQLTLTNDVTLYAKWSAEQAIPWKIIIWKQKTTDEPGTTNKTYDFVASVAKTAAPGTEVSVDDTYKTVDGLSQEGITGIDPDGFDYAGCDNPTTVDNSGYTVLNVYYDRKADAPTPAGSYKLVFRDSMTPLEDVEWTGNGLPIEFEEIPYGTLLESFVPADPRPAMKGYSGQEVFTFDGWYADEICSTRVFFDRASYDSYRYGKVLYENMPAEDLTLYAGWSANWFLVQVDPNYGAFNGTGGTWFWETFDGELVREYTQMTRDYVKSSSGQTYYAKRDRAYYGYSGNEWDNSEPDRDAYYTNNPDMATEATTFEYSPGTYTYAGWYEVNADGTETPYDFSRRVDHDLTIRLHWKKAGVYYLEYDAGEGLLDNGEKTERIEQPYADCSGITLTRTASITDGSVFVGWRVKDSDSGVTYKPGTVFMLSSDNAVRIGGKEVVTLVAVYQAAPESTSITYDANGGTVAGNADFGKNADDVPLTGDVSEDGKSATVNSLADGTRITLSGGQGFTFAEGVRLVGWKDEADRFNALNGGYTVSAIKPATFTAIWQTNVTYHLNDEDGKGDWAGFRDLPSSIYYYNGVDNTYNQVAYIGDPVSEPNAAPAYRDDEKLFQFWATRNGEEGSYTYIQYDFAQPVEGALDLYAVWMAPEVIRIHAVNATVETLVEETGWHMENVVDMDPEGKGIQLGTAQTELNAASHIIPPDDDYVFAFVAVSKSLETVSEDKAVTAIRYNGTRKGIEARFANSYGFTPLEEDDELYFVYYEKKQVTIGYDSMDTNGTLATITDIGSGAPAQTGFVYINSEYAVYDMAENITQPMGWVNDSTYPYYAFALGTTDVADASGLTLITSVSSDDATRPTLALRSTWRGFEYATTYDTPEGSDSKNWTGWKSCGYDVQLYVLYYDKLPTVVTFSVETVGLQADVTDQEFKFDYTITNIVNGQPTPIYNYHDKNGGEYITLRSGESYSTILFTSGNTTQSVTIFQNLVDGFEVAIDGAEQHPEEEGFVSCSVTPDATTVGGTIDVIFTNTRVSVPVEAHVAMVGNNGIILRDDQRSTVCRFDLGLNESAVLLDALPADGLFTGDAESYAFGTILYAPEAEDEQPISVGGMGISRIACLPLEKDSNIYELVLQDDKGNKLAVLDDNWIYYLYYLTPVIKYVKAIEVEGEAKYNLNPVTGLVRSAETGELVEVTDGMLTYSLAPITMNGGIDVVQNQRLELPQEGLTISQSGNNFRMPYILDDGSTLAERYLTYSYLLAGTATMTDITEEGLRPGEGMTLRLRIFDNALQYSYDGTEWAPFEGERPSIYAVYVERGYDLLITKTVDMAQSGENTIFTEKYFTVTLTSDKIKGVPETEGEEGEIKFIPADPAVENSKGQLVLTVRDGSRVKLLGLPKGEYTVEESENGNYDLSAKAGAIVGGIMRDITLPAEPLTLDTEIRVDLVNTPKVICKIGDELFYTLNDAVDYAAEVPDRTATIEMLTDYTLPLLDAVEIPAGYDITLATAENDLEGNPIVAPWTIKRDADMAGDPMFDNKGTLTFANITIDGALIPAAVPMVETSGKLTVHEAAVLKRAVSTGNGGAIHAAAGDIDIYGSIENNEASNGAAVYCVGDGNIKVSGNAHIADNVALGSGGAIYYAGNGEISLSGQGAIEENRAEDGGAIYYTGNGSINISQNITINNNTAQYGGAIYAASGSVSVSAEAENSVPTISGNYAAENGGAFWIGTGSLSVSGGNITGNGNIENGGVITKLGGAIYVDSGALTVSDSVITTIIDGGTDDGESGGDGESTSPTTSETLVKPTITGNNAENGAAIFVNTGSATFTGGEVTGNIVPGSGTVVAGGAVGVGETSARLYFSGTAQVTGNTYGSGENALPSNVYLDQDTDAIINTSGLTDAGNVGIYVPNKYDKDGIEYLYKNRGGVGGLFGVFTDAEASVDGFHNDRWDKLYALRDETARKIFWSSPVTVEIRYLGSFQNGFPTGKNGEQKLAPTEYYPTNEKMAFSAIADALRNKCSNLNASAVYATTLKLDKSRTDSDYPPVTDYSNYLTKLVWKDNMWKVIGRNGEEKPLVELEEVIDPETGETSRVEMDTKLVLYYALPAFVSIENNNPYALEITGMTIKMPGSTKSSVINAPELVGCGLVFARDAVIQPDLLPVEMTNNTLTLDKFGSINVLIPGGQNRDFTLAGSFVDDDGHPVSGDIRLRLNGTDKNPVNGSGFELPRSGETLKTNNNTNTYEIIFGDDKYICKIWVPNRFNDEDSAREYYREHLAEDENPTEEEYSSRVVQDGDKYVVLDAGTFDTAAAAKVSSIAAYGPRYGEDADVLQVGDQWAVVSRHEEPFSTMRSAVTFAREHDLHDIVIEMIVDYLMPGSDVVKITESEQFVSDDRAKNSSVADYVPFIAVEGIEKITFTTATKGQYRYEGTGAASISRGNGNTIDPVITVSVQDKDANNFPDVALRNLNFDGKALTGTCDGGALKTKNCKVDIEDANFKNFISQNGGAIFIAYGEEESFNNNKATRYKFDGYNEELLKTSEKLMLQVKTADFTNCESKTTKSRCGGGAIWVNGRVLQLEDCTFVNCKASDQGGAIFHRIESQNKNDYYRYPYCTETQTIIKGTRNTFTLCEANAAGGIESDAQSIDIASSTFTLCKAKERGGGGINIYIHDDANYNVNDTDATFTDCTFIGCTAKRDGGGVNCATKYTTLSNCSFRDCKVTGLNNADSKGGGVYFKNMYGEYAKVFGCTFEGCSTSIETYPVGQALQALEGGAIACKAKNLYINIDESGKVVDDKTTILRCSAITNGGAIYMQGSGKTTIYNTEIDGGTAGYCGGGFYTTSASSVTFTDSSIKNCKANAQSGPKDKKWGGGGIYHAIDNKLTLIGTTVQGNSALTANSYGGGVFVNKLLELQNSYILDNRLLDADAEHAAGVYIADNTTGAKHAVLEIGDRTKAKVEDYFDNTEITGNLASGNRTSNLRLPENNGVNLNIVQVYCNLGPKANAQGKMEGGVIGVVNAKVVGTQFGLSPYSEQGTEGWRPAGLGDQDAVFRSDNSTLHGIIDRSDTKNQKIIWGGPPICKLTDAAGHDLYFQAGDPAIFDRLDTDDVGERTSPFSLLRGSSMPALSYYVDGTLQRYEGTAYCLKMLVETYELDAPIEASLGSDIRVTFTTAGRTGNDRDYPYKGTPERDGTCRATLTCADAQPLLKMSGSIGQLSLESIILDGNSHASPVVRVTGSKLVLGTKAILQNTNNIGENGNGGGVYITAGEFQIQNGTIRNCTAQNGGGVYVDGGKFTFAEGSITRCEAKDNGGGVYVGGGEFRMNGGTIGYSSASASNRNTAKIGGGVFVADGKSMYMAGGTIRNNRAETRGGGIAVGDRNTKLYFSGYVLVTGNTCEASVMSDKTCNVELHLSNTGIINTGPDNALTSRANIGIYVTGENDEEPFSTNGQEGQPFGTFNGTDHVKTLYCFINDRNYLKGGLTAEQDVGQNQQIYWIRIFKLLVENQVVVSENAPGDADIAAQAQFSFNVMLKDDSKNTGKIKVKDIFDEIQEEGPEGRYGAIPFKRIKDDNSEIYAEFALGSGETTSSQNLPANLIYNVDETGDSLFEIFPTNTRYGYTGQVTEYKEDPYTTRLVFRNVLPVCKITDSNGDLLYQQHSMDQEGKTVVVYRPAVFAELIGDNGAFKALEGDFYYSTSESSGTKITDEEKVQGLQIQMLVSEYTLQESLTVPEDMKLTLTTAGTSGMHPYRGSGNTARITRAFDGGPMLISNGDLTLKNITLDGAKGSRFYANQNGGIVLVKAGSSLTVTDGAALQDSRTTADGGVVYLEKSASMTVNGGTLTGGNARYGGAVYVASGASMTFTSGSIESNKCNASGEGAGVYLSEGAELKLSGSPDFGGTGIGQGRIMNTNGNMKDGSDRSDTNGRMTYTKMRQDIYIAGYESVVAASLVVDGSFDDSVKAGSIWVWAEKENHYRAEMQFARIGENAGTVTGNTLLAFRNARPDADTEASKTGSYLHGEGAGGYVRWNSLAVCKLTDGYNVILYQYDASGTLVPAVYTTVKAGFDAASNGLYTKEGSEYTGGALKLKLLQDYTLTAEDSDIISNVANLTFTTAERIKDLDNNTISQMASNGDTFFYSNDSSSIATLSRGSNYNTAASMITVNSGNLTLTNVILDGQKIETSADGGIVKVKAGSALTVTTGAVLQNSRTSGKGGAVYVESGSSVTMTGGTATSIGGKVNNNESTGDGAGIYLEYTNDTSHATLHLSGKLNFGGAGLDNSGNILTTAGNFKAGTLEEKTNGSMNYTKARQDIFIAGYESADDTDKSAASLVIDGNIGSGDGTIWVWAEKLPHYKTLCQFAKISVALSDPEGTLHAFRNARPDDETAAAGQYLYGITKSGDTGNAYWYGVEGSRKVILRKVQKDTYQPLNRQFRIYSDQGLNVPARDSEGNETWPEGEWLSSGGSGAFYVGTLNYGTYYILEDDPRNVFVLKIDDTGYYECDANGNPLPAGNPVPTNELGD